MELEKVGEELSIDYFQNFITLEKEAEIVNYFNFDKINKTNSDRNNVLRFGSRFPYSNNFVSEKIPTIFIDIMPNNCTSVTVNEYLPGQFLDYHIDMPPNEKIYILSLLNEATLKFRNKKNHSEVLDFELEPLSLSIIEGKLRWEYEHKLITEKYRLSIVFR